MRASVFSAGIPCDISNHYRGRGLTIKAEKTSQVFWKSGTDISICHEHGRQMFVGFVDSEFRIGTTTLPGE